MYRTEHLSSIPQVSDGIAFKFRTQCELELTELEQAEADAVIKSAMDTLREFYVAWRVAMPYVRGLRREVWMTPDGDGWTEDE